MKVILSNDLPFFLAHGGVQTLIESLWRHLAGLGVDVEPARWWDERQRGDILHFFGRPGGLAVRLAHGKGFKVVMTEFLDQTASRPALRLAGQRGLIRSARRLLGPLTARLGWDAYGELDALIYAVPHELQVAHYLFDAPLDRGRIIPHGLDADALADLRRDGPEEDYLLCVATLHPRKNTVLLAEAARLSGVPVVFAGRPYAESDAYGQRFQSLVDGRSVRAAGFVDESRKRELLRRARGFVLLSRHESGGIALYEAAAAGLPLLLPDLPWARKSYPPSPRIRYVPLGSAARVAPALRAFYEAAHRTAAAPTFPVSSWEEVARQHLELYRGLTASAAPRPSSSHPSV